MNSDQTTATNPAKLFDQKKRLQQKLRESNEEFYKIRKRTEYLQKELEFVKNELRKVCDHDWEYVRNGEPCGPTLWYCQKCGNFK